MSNSKKKQKTNDVDRLLDGYDVTCLVLGEPMNKSWSGSDRRGQKIN